jgi:hypothetical protein
MSLHWYIYSWRLQAAENDWHHAEPMSLAVLSELASWCVQNIQSGAKFLLTFSAWNGNRPTLGSS